MSKKFRPQLESMEDRVVPSTLWVTNTLSGFTAGSLSYEVWLSNTMPGLDTISFAVGGHFTPSSALELSDSVNINGPGASNITIDGLNQHRLFQVDRGVTATISGLTLYQGLTTDNGGGIVNFGGLNLVNDTFLNNGAYQTGGAVAVAPGAWCVAHQCQFTRNIAMNAGGAVANYGGMRDEGSTYSANTSYGLGGGAVYTAGGFDFEGSAIISNGTLGQGGGVLNAPGAYILFNNVAWSQNYPQNFYQM